MMYESDSLGCMYSIETQTSGDHAFFEFESSVTDEEATQLIQEATVCSGLDINIGLLLTHSLPEDRSPPEAVDSRPYLCRA
jgi:hypothetical protein